MNDALYEYTGISDSGWCVAEDAMPYGDLSYAVNGALMKVHRELGPGWDEKDYHLCALDELQHAGLSVKSKLRGTLFYHGTEIDRFELDIMVQDSLVIELKHLQNDFAPAHFTQLINYMTFWRKDVGLLCNFGQESLRYRRLTSRHELAELAIVSQTDTKSVVDCRPIAVALEALIKERLTSYSLTTMNKLIAVELQHVGSTCRKLCVQPKSSERELPPREVNAWVVNDNVLLMLSAHPDGPARQNRAILRSYMKQSQTPKGILVNFSSTQIAICPMTL